MGESTLLATKDATMTSESMVTDISSVGIQDGTTVMDNPVVTTPLPGGIGDYVEDEVGKFLLMILPGFFGMCGFICCIFCLYKCWKCYQNKRKKGKEGRSHLICNKWQNISQY